MMTFIDFFYRAIYEELRSSLGFYGDLASVLGFILSLAGFALTLWGLREIRLETRRARREVKGVVDTFSSKFLIGRVEFALEQIQRMSNACRERQWTRAIDRYEEASGYLVELVDEPKIGNPTKARLSGFIDDLKLIKRTIQILKNGNRPNEEALTVINKIDEMLLHLRRLGGGLRRDDLSSATTPRSAR